MYVITIPPEEINQTPGQAGQPGPQRIRRMEFRATADEHLAISRQARDQGFAHVASFVRERALHGADTPTARLTAILSCHAEINRLTVRIDAIAQHLTGGHPADEDLLLVLLQIQDMAEEGLKAILRQYEEPAEVM